MLTRDQLADLHRALQQERVLTVYADGTGKDPASRRVWRRRVEQEMEREAHRLKYLESNQRDGFEEARELVLKDLDAYQSFLPAKGYMAFATPDGIRYSATIPVQVPTLVRWEKGLRLAPYIRGLKQLRPMVTVLVDARRGRVFQYQEGEVEEIVDLRADTFLGDLSEAATSSRASKHSGSRGETATDAAQRYLEKGTERMLKEVRDLVMDLAGSVGFVLLGGTQDSLAMLRPMLSGIHESRIFENHSLWLEMTLAEVKNATAQAASVLSFRRQMALLDQVEEQAYARGNGSLGGKDTFQALEAGAVDILILSRGFVEANPDYADACVTKAFEQGAEVRVFGSGSSERLDEVGGGIGARLRFRPPGVEPMVEATAS